MESEAARSRQARPRRSTPRPQLVSIGHRLAMNVSFVCAGEQVVLGHACANILFGVFKVGFRMWGRGKISNFRRSLGRRGRGPKRKRYRDYHILVLNYDFNYSFECQSLLRKLLFVTCRINFFTSLIFFV